MSDPVRCNVSDCLGLCHCLHTARVAQGRDVRSLVLRVGAALGPALDDAHEAPVVDEALLRPARHLLLLLLLRDLRRLVLHLSGARQTAVHLAHGLTLLALGSYGVRTD